MRYPGPVWIVAARGIGQACDELTSRNSGGVHRVRGRQRSLLGFVHRHEMTFARVADAVIDVMAC